MRLNLSWLAPEAAILDAICGLADHAASWAPAYRADPAMALFTLAA